MAKKKTADELNQPGNNAKNKVPFEAPGAEAHPLNKVSAEVREKMIDGIAALDAAFDIDFDNIEFNTVNEESNFVFQSFDPESKHYKGDSFIGTFIRELAGDPLAEMPIDRFGGYLFRDAKTKALTVISEYAQLKAAIARDSRISDGFLVRLQSPGMKKLNSGNNMCELVIGVANVKAK